MLYGVKEFQVKIAHTEVDCISFGRGASPLVMIQGLNTRGIKGAGFSLAWMYRLFAKDYRVYLFDRRPEVREGITVRELAGDAASAMDSLGIRNAHILGVSQGGMIAQHLAIDRPELVRSLVLAVTAARPNPVIRSVIERWITLAEQGHTRELIADMAEKMYSEAYLRRYRPFLPLLTVLQRPRDLRRFTILANACLTCDTYDDLDKIQCPVLVVGGKQDQIVGGSAPEEIAERLRCKRILYDNLGHAAYEEAKNFNKQVLDFFNQQ